MSVAEQKNIVRTCACVHAFASVSLCVCARAPSCLGAQVHMRVHRRVGGRRCVRAMTVRSANVAGVTILKLEVCFKAQRPHWAHVRPTMLGEGAAKLSATVSLNGLLVTISVSLGCTFRSMSFAYLVSFEVSVAMFLAFSLSPSVSQVSTSELKAISTHLRDSCAQRFKHLRGGEQTERKCLHARALLPQSSDS